MSKVFVHCNRVVVQPVDGSETASKLSKLTLAIVSLAFKDSATADAYARRLAACWNACDGIDVDDLEKGIVEEALRSRKHVMEGR